MRKKHETLYVESGVHDAHTRMVEPPIADKNTTLTSTSVETKVTTPDSIDQTNSIENQGMLVIEESVAEAPVSAPQKKQKQGRFFNPHDLRTLEGDFYEHQQEHSKTIETQHTQLIEMITDSNRLMRSILDELSQHTKLLKDIKILLKEKSETPKQHQDAASTTPLVAIEQE